MKRLFSFLLAGCLLFSCCPALFSFAGEPESGAFSSSFEEEDLPVVNDCVASSGVYKLNNEIHENPADPTGVTGAEIDLASVTATPHYSNHVVSNLFDNKPSTKYLVMDSSTASVTFALKSAAVLTSYALTSGNDRAQRDPKSWNLYGSANGTDWTLLDSVTDAVFANRLQTNVYTVSNSVSYLWYKLDVLSNNGVDDLGMNIVQLSELAINVPTGEQLETGFTVVRDSIDGSTALSGEGKENLFDRSAETKTVVQGQTMWVSFRIAEPETVTAYKMVSANDYPERDPKTWTVYGSNDGSSWTEIDHKSGQAFSSRHEAKLYRLNESVCYTYYKLDVEEKYGVNSYVQLADFTLLTASEVPPYESGMEASVLTNEAWSGSRSLFVSGVQLAKTGAQARTVIYDGLSVPVGADARFSYLIRPILPNGEPYDYEYTSCRVMLDLHFTDGTLLSGMGLTDERGSAATPAGQAQGKTLVVGQWNTVVIPLGDAAGKTIDRVDAWFEKASSSDSFPFAAYFDCLNIAGETQTAAALLSDYIDVRRGTYESGLSRGDCLPAVTLPNGFNFYTPVTDPAVAASCYLTTGEEDLLNSISVIHAPSGQSAYGTWQFMPNTSVNTSTTPTSTTISSDARKAKFSHENEIAHAHYYSVLLDEGTPASGVKIEVTPTSHAAYVRFTFPANAENVNVIFDSLWGTGKMTFNTSDQKSFTAYTNHNNSAGSKRMYVCGEFDTQYSYSKVVSTKKGIVSFPHGTTVVTMKIATSFISAAQAQHNLELEIGNKTFDGVFAAAQGEWDALCGKFEIEGASCTELVNFYSSLYRMYAYPNLYSENEGTNEEPVWVYSSPYSGAKTAGVLYTNSDLSSRMVWAARSLFTANKTGELLEGLLLHLTDGGALPETVCPGAADAQTASDALIFADAYFSGIDFDFGAVKALLRQNALTCAETDAESAYLGYVSNDLPESFSRSLQRALADFALYKLALAEGNDDEAEYFRDSCLRYSLLFNGKAGFFMGRSTTGVFSAGASDFDPTLPGGPKGDFAGGSGWTNVFPAVYDGEGVTALYGGRAALTEKLNALFTVFGSSSDEVNEIKLGQYTHSDPSARHLIYAFAFSNEPWRAQAYARDVLNRAYAGAELGQGYIGEDAWGDQSAWYVFSALGLYPFDPSSGEYVFGSPLFDRVTVHLDNGEDLVIAAENNSEKNVYIQSAAVNGQPYDKLFLTKETLTGGCTLSFVMGALPSSFGEGAAARPSSLSPAGSKAGCATDLTCGAFLSPYAYEGQSAVSDAQVFTDLSNASRLFDDNALSATALSDGAAIVLTGRKPHIVDRLTVTCSSAADAPDSLVLEASDNGAVWKRLLEKELSFSADNEILPLSVPAALRGSYRLYRLTFAGGTSLAEIELCGSVGTAFENPLGDFVYGDVDQNLTVTISDVTALLNYLSYMTEETEYLPVCDLDNNGTIAIPDVTALLDLLSRPISHEDDPSGPFIPEPFEPSDAYAAPDGRVSLSWDYADPDGDGFEGAVSISVSDSAAFGVYTVCYGDDDGALEDCLPLGTANVQNTNAAYTVFTASETTAPPLGAKAVVVKNAAGTILAYEELPAHKRARGGALLGTFAAISDVHVFENAPYSGQYSDINGDEDLRRAVGVINGKNVDFTAVTGDLILSFMDNEDQINAELAKSTGILAGLDAPCCVVKGNHDKKVDEAVWRSMTGCALDYAFTFGGARFIFLSLLTVSNVGSVDDAPYGQAKLDWLENELNEHADKRVLLFMHYPISGQAGLVPGNSYGFSAGSAEEARLLSMLVSHGNVTAFNGHTHYDFASSGTYADISVSRVDRQNVYFVHLPSVAYPRNASNVTVTAESEGYIVRLCENGLLLEAIDFVTGKYEPSATCFLDTRPANNAPAADTLRLAVGESAPLEFENAYESASFRSSNESVAAVSEAGLVTAVAPGNAVLYCRVDGVTYKVTVVVLDESSVMRGSGTKDDPYILTSADHFVYIQNEFRSGRDLANVYFAMGNDICLNDSANYRPSVSSEEGSFAGYFDGRGHVLSATTLLSAENFAVPFFYHLTGTVVNTVFETDMGGCAKTSYAVARTMNGGKLVNCIVRGSLYASNANTSIVCGTSSGALIAGCFIDVTVTGTTPGSSESGITLKGSATVRNVFYVPNGCTAHFGETAVDDAGSVAEAMNASLSSTASAAGLSPSELCAWQTDAEDQPTLISV